VGSFGDISTLSFYPNKHITTGEGGMILTDDEGLAAKCRSLRNLCFLPEKRFLHEELGYNFRMTNMQAALGVAQLERLEEFVLIKRAMGAKYTSLFRDNKHFQIPAVNTDYAQNIYWVYGVVLNDDVPFDAAAMMKKLAEKGVGSRPFFWPMHEQPVFHKMGLFKNESYPVAERIARRGFYVPSGLALKEHDMETVANVVLEILADRPV
jgi:perosamine synthetase